MSNETTVDPALGKLVEQTLTQIPDFPSPGVTFRDFSTFLSSGRPFQQVMQALAEHYRGQIDAVAGLESRGFVIAAPLAAALGVPMLMLRKAGKLPPPVIAQSYNLEYGTATLEIKPNTVHQSHRVLIVDDVLATGGTARAAVDLIRQAGGQAAEVFVLMELQDLGGREQITDIKLTSLLRLSEPEK